MFGRGGDESVRVPLWATLGAALALLVGIRLSTFGSVFRGDDIVLLSNDPYVFLYLVERALTEGAIARFDPVVAWRGEPLLIWTLAAFAMLFGGVGQADLVLALYPVVTALLSGVLVFVLARTLTGDVRIGLAAVAILAVTPLHVSRTALGFADHHAFDYLWLTLTATAVVWLLARADAGTRQRYVVGCALGVGVAAQTLAWRVSPLMLAPLAIALAVAAPIVARRDAPVRTLAPIVAGLGVAAVVVQLVHRTLAWQNDVVAATPVLLFVGSVAILGLVAAVERTDRSWPTLVCGELLVAVVTLGLVWLLAPELVGDALARIDAFQQYVQRHQQTNIGETTPITDAFGPVLGPLILLGFAPFLGLPAVVWGLGHGWREREAGWFVLAVYVCWFLVLALVQRRWAVQLGLFLAVFAAVGFLGFAYWLALVTRPGPLRDEPSGGTAIEPPDRQRLALLGAMGAVGLGGSSLYATEILSRVSIDESAYRAAAWIRDYSAELGLSYPQNYVLAQWGRVRMYNYFVNGEARRYGYARQNYEALLFSTEPEEWYQQLKGRVGFVVTRADPGALPLRMQSRLHDNYGSASDAVGGLGHYRALWESQDRSVKVFSLVPGATITGTGPPDTEFVVRTTATIAGTDDTFEYRRRVTTDDDGAFSVVVAHPGEYDASIETNKLTVSESHVRNGLEIVWNV